jgi:xylulokinase
VQVLREQTGAIERIVLTGGAAQSRAVQLIAPAVFGLPVAITAPMESVALGAARQAAWAYTGKQPDWPVEIVEQRDPNAADSAAAREIDERYRSILTDHYLRARS